MKHYVAISALTAVLLCTGPGPAVFAQEWAEKMFDSMEYDFGNLARGAKAEHRFKITNVYQEDIQILGAKSSCGCTTPRLTRQLLRSGETAELVAEFNTLSFEGQHTATITLTFGPPFSGESRLHVHGFVRQDVVFKPGRVELGTVPEAAGVEREVLIAYAGNPDWRIVDIRSSNRHYEVELQQRSRSAGRVEYVMLFRLKKETPPGLINDPLTLVTNDEQHELIPLQVEGQVQPSLTVSPTSLHLGVVRPGQSVTKQLVVRGSTPFRITSIECEEGSDCFEFSPPDEPRTLHLVPVTFTARKTSGKLVQRIRIATDGAAGSLPVVVAQVEVRDE